MTGHKDGTYKTSHLAVGVRVYHMANVGESWGRGTLITIDSQRPLHW